MVALDLSDSMAAVMDNLPDDLKALVEQPWPAYRPTRLDAAKAVMRDFISRRSTDRIGIVVFGTQAYVLSPLTLDYHLLDQMVARLELGLIEAATAIGEGVGVAAARLRRPATRWCFARPAGSRNWRSSTCATSRFPWSRSANRQAPSRPGRRARPIS